MSAGALPADTAETLQRLSLEIVGTLDLDRVLLSIANAATRLLSSAMAGVFLVDPPGSTEELLIQCIVGHRMPASARLRIPAGHGIAGLALSSGRPVRVDVYQAAPITKDFRRHALEEGTRSGMAVPLRDTAGVIIGVLIVWRRRPSVWSDADEALLVSLGRLAAIGLVNAGQYAAQQRAMAEVEAARVELAQRLEFSDASLAVHRRLTEIAAQGQDLLALAQAVQGFVGDTVLIAPDGDRPPVQWPPPTRGRPAVPRGREVVELTEPARRTAGPRWVRVPIESAGLRLGSVYARLGTGPSLRDVVTLEQSATICALLLGQQSALAAAATRLQAEFVWALLDGRVDAAGGLGRAGALGLHLAYPARVVLVRADGFADLGRREQWSTQQHEQNRDWLVQRLARAFALTAGQDVPTGARDDDVVALLPDGMAGADRIAKALRGCSPFPTVHLQAGVSGPANAAGLPHALYEARVALSAVDAGTGPAVVFDELGVLQFLLGPGGAGELNRYAERVLGRLQAYDLRHNTDLVATLDAYLENSGNAAATARALGLHAKSLAYRLRRITEVGELDLEDRRTRLDVELALRIIGPVADLRERSAGI